MSSTQLHQFSPNQFRVITQTTGWVSMWPHRTRTTSSSAAAERRAARSTAFSSALTQRFDPGVEEPKTSSSSRHGTPAAAGMKNADRQPPKRQIKEVTLCTASRITELPCCPR